MQSWRHKQGKANITQKRRSAGSSVPVPFDMAIDTVQKDDAFSAEVTESEMNIIQRRIAMQQKKVS